MGSFYWGIGVAPLSSLTGGKQLFANLRRMPE